MSVDARRALLCWYAVDKRHLPWRAEAGERADPYRVWLSEIMLQQTTVAAVKPYFERFTTKWPDVGALAAADEADVMREWAGLGYYARARNLVACARVVAGDHGGRFPDSEAAMAFSQLAAVLPQWDTQETPRSGTGFMDLLIAASRDWAEADGVKPL